MDLSIPPGMLGLPTFAKYDAAITTHPLGLLAWKVAQAREAGDYYILCRCEHLENCLAELIKE